jgi:hypothetical protein
MTTSVTSQQDQAAEFPIICDLNVVELFGNCKSQEGEDVSTTVKIETMDGEVTLSIPRLDQHRSAVLKLLSQLPRKFKTTGLPCNKLAYDSTNRTWASSLNRVIELIGLASALGLVEVFPSKICHSTPVDYTNKIVRWSKTA